MSAKPVVQPPVNIGPILVDIREAARLLSASVWAVRSAVWRGELRPVRIGNSKKYLFRPEELRAFVNTLSDATQDCDEIAVNILPRKLVGTAPPQKVTLPGVSDAE